MNPLRPTTLLVLVAVSISAAGATAATCALPVPDGSNKRPTAPNVHGVIAEVKGQEVVVRQAKTGKLVAIRLSERPEIYSAFGGDVDTNELESGQVVWVWFVGCKWPPTGKPYSAYLQIYSKDPSDKPK